MDERESKEMEVLERVQGDEEETKKHKERVKIESKEKETLEVQGEKRGRGMGERK